MFNHKSLISCLFKRTIFTKVSFQYYYLNEATWLIVIGLGLDIVGVLVIIGLLRRGRHILNRLVETLNDINDEMKKSKGHEISLETNREKIDRLTHIIYDRQIEELEEIKPMIIGIVLLISGFILQIIGNWFQNTPF